MMRELKNLGHIYGDLKTVACSGFHPDHPLWHKYHTSQGQAELDALSESERAAVLSRLDGLQSAYQSEYGAMLEHVQLLMGSIDGYMQAHRRAAGLTLSDVLEGGPTNGTGPA